MVPASRGPVPARLPLPPSPASGKQERPSDASSTATPQASASHTCPSRSPGRRKAMNGPLATPRRRGQPMARRSIPEEGPMGSRVVVLTIPGASESYIRTKSWNRRGSRLPPACASDPPPRDAPGGGLGGGDPSKSRGPARWGELPPPSTNPASLNQHHR